MKTATTHNIEIEKTYVFKNQTGYIRKQKVTRITDSSVFSKSINEKGFEFPEHRESIKTFNRYIETSLVEII